MTHTLVEISRDLSAVVDRLSFSLPVTHVYNPLSYARRSHEDYLERFGRGCKRVVFLGMNPGPFGMAQTGVPFWDVQTVGVWLAIDQPVGAPRNLHPRRPVQGLECARVEVSG
ncbi:MAG: single-stranded DNA-binding protein, partial [Acidobacteriota bacterium]